MTGTPQLPRLIHWWWDGPPVPPEFLRFRDRWEELHPDWTVEVWNEDRFRSSFDGFEYPVLACYHQRERWSPGAHEWGWKTNIARYVILHRLGGLWVDADLEPLRSVDPLIERLVDGGDWALVAREDRRFINNAFMASHPGGAFITDVINGLGPRIKRQRGKPSNVATGPHYLTEVAAVAPGHVEILDPALIYPMHWSELERRGESFPAAYTLHHWNRKTEGRQVRKTGTIKLGRVPGGATKVPAVTRSAPTTSRTPRRPSTMKIPMHIRRTKGLTPEPVALALADMAAGVPQDQAIVELGVYQAKTAIIMAWGARQRNRAHVWAIDPWDLPGDRGPYNQNPDGSKGEHRKSFTDPGTRKWAEHNVKSLGFRRDITLVRGFSATEGERWTGPPVGLLFVDGDHRYDAVRRDLTSWAPHLAPGAVVAFDDYADTHPEVIRAVDDMVSEGILEPLEIFHDRLAVTRLARREQVLPPAIEGDETERESPGTGEPMVERVASAFDVPAELVTEGVPPRTEAEQRAWGDFTADFIHDPDTLVDPGTDPGKPCPPPDSVYVDAATPEELTELEATTALDDLNAGQLRRLASVRGVEVEGDKRVKEVLLEALRAAR